MKKILYTLLFLFILCLISCQQEERALQGKGEGYLSLANITLQSESNQIIASRAVDRDLNIEIWDAEGTTKVEDYAAGTVPTKIPLKVGTYTLKAYTQSPDKMDKWTNADKGEQVFYVETQQQQLVIKEDEVTSLSLKVPMINFGVSLSLPDDFDTFFKDYTFKVTVGDRTVTLENGGTAYFAFEAGATFSYTLSATNSDDEKNIGDVKVYSQVNQGTIYCVTYKMEGRSISSVVQ